MPAHFLHIFMNLNYTPGHPGGVFSADMSEEKRTFSHSSLKHSFVFYAAGFQCRLVRPLAGFIVVYFHNMNYKEKREIHVEDYLHNRKE